MLQLIKGSLVGITVTLLLACGQPNDIKIVGEKPENSTEKTMPKTVFKTVKWIDLMPKSDLDALLTPPDYLDEIQDGSFEDQINNQVQNTVPSDASSNDDNRYHQALISTRIIPEMEGQAIRIPGFVVPLEFNGEQTVTQFFLVPFFGACIHEPAPPPNQIIFIDYPQGIKLNSLYEPVWVSGILNTSIIENEIAKAAYTMQVNAIEIYTEEE
jgi:hypothetical protein